MCCDVAKGTLSQINQIELCIAWSGEYSSGHFETKIRSLDNV